MLQTLWGLGCDTDTNEREEARNILQMLHSKPHLPWVCMRDFNEILLSEKKRGGRARPHRQMQAFWDVLDTCGFLDLDSWDLNLLGTVMGMGMSYGKGWIEGLQTMIGWLDSQQQPSDIFTV